MGVAERRIVTTDYMIVFADFGVERVGMVGSTVEMRLYFGETAVISVNFVCVVVAVH